METPRRTFRWSPAPANESTRPAELKELLRELVDDRASSARELVREANREILDWLATRPSSWSFSEARAELARGLAELAEAHRWRAGVAGWLDALTELVETDRWSHVPARDAVAEECGLWLGGANASDDPWSGEPLAPGVRLADPQDAADSALEGMAFGEVVLAHGYSEALVAAFLAAHARGLGPTPVISEGGPELHGRRLATELARAGLEPRLVHDLALQREVAYADRLWLVTESVGAESLVAPIGTRALAEEARRREVPVVVPTTTEILAPAGAAALPPWGERERWLLWQDAPAGVRVEACPWEHVPLDLVDHFATERGRLTVGELSLAALRTEPRAIEDRATEGRADDDLRVAPRS